MHRKGTRDTKLQCVFLRACEHFYPRYNLIKGWVDRCRKGFTLFGQLQMIAFTVKQFVAKKLLKVLIWWLTALWVINNSSAARLKFLQRDVAQKASNDLSGGNCLNIVIIISAIVQHESISSLWQHCDWFSALFVSATSTDSSESLLLVLFIYFIAHYLHTCWHFLAQLVSSINGIPEEYGRDRLGLKAYKW